MSLRRLAVDVVLGTGVILSALSGRTKGEKGYVRWEVMNLRRGTCREILSCCEWSG
jgi:hypothetical protein